MKYDCLETDDVVASRSPHGERGLKSDFDILDEADESLPAWGAWIEIAELQWIEMKRSSLPAWGAWIEMWL